MASIKISNTAVEANLANVEGLVGYRTNPTTQALETVQITGDYIGGSSTNAPRQGFISTKPFTVYENETDIVEFPGNSNRSILSYSGVETYGNLEVFSHNGGANFIGEFTTTVKSNSASLLLAANGNFQNSPQDAVTIATLGAAHKGAIAISSNGSDSENQGIKLRSATNIKIDLHSVGNDSAPVVGQALLAKDTDGNVRFGDAVKLAETAQAVPNSGLRYSSIGNNGLQVNGITARGIKVTTSQTSGVQVDFSGVTTTANKASIGAPMLGVIQAADATAARTVLDVDQAGTDNSTPVTLAGPGTYLTVSNNEITQSQIDLADQDNSTSNFTSADNLKIATTQSGLPNIKIEFGTDTQDPADPGVNASSSVTIETPDDSGLFIDGGDYGFDKVYPIAINLDQLDTSSPVVGASPKGVGKLMDAANQTLGNKLEFGTVPSSTELELLSVPQSPDIVCELSSNTNLDNMDSGNAYVVPFTDSAASHQGFYQFNSNNSGTSTSWNSWIKIAKAGRYMINTKVGMYNAEKNNPNNPTLTVWIVVEDEEPTALGNVVAPTNNVITTGDVHCVGSCQINRDINGLGLIQGSTMLDVLADQYVRVVVRPDGFSGTGGDRAYFVYNDVEIPAGSGNVLSGHKPQIEIYKIN